MTKRTDDAALEVRVVAQAVLVAEAEATEVLANDALDDLGREAAVDLRRAHADLRALASVRAAEAAVARAEALTGAGAGAVADACRWCRGRCPRRDRRRLRRCRRGRGRRRRTTSPIASPHMLPRARQRVVAERVVATPRRRRRVRIAAGARVEEADHAELRRFAERGLARDVRVRVVLRALDAVALVRSSLVFGLPIEPSSPLARVPVPPSLLSAFVLGDLLGLLLLLLALGGRLEVLLDEVLLVAVERLLVRRARAAA